MDLTLSKVLTMTCSKVRVDSIRVQGSDLIANYSCLDSAGNAIYSGITQWGAPDLVKSLTTGCQAAIEKQVLK